MDVLVKSKIFCFFLYFPKDAVKMQKILNQKLVDNSVDEDSEGDEDTNTSSSTGTKKKGRPKLNPATPSVSGSGSAAVSPVAISAISPKAKIPNNPLLKKKLLNLQKFLTEYTVTYLFI